MSVFAYHAPDSAPIVLCRGARVAWDSPAGLGGTHLTGVVVGVQADTAGVLHVVGVDADPSPSLRAARVELRALLPRPLPHVPMPWAPWPLPPARSGIDGDGGLVLFTGDGVRRAIDAGQLVVAPPTIRSRLRAYRVLLPRWLRSTRYRFVDRLWGWVERGLVDGIGRLGLGETGARGWLVGWLVVAQARRRRAREQWWRAP